jgi:antitoxin HigA-1
MGIGKKRSIMTDSSEKLIHPGEVLGEVYMKPFHPPITVADLAESLDVSAQELTTFISGKRPVTMPLAVRLAIRFRTTAGFWLGLQDQYNKRFQARTTHQMHRLKR